MEGFIVFGNKGHSGCSVGVRERAVSTKVLQVFEQSVKGLNSYVAGVTVNS